jgi:hypothetical protein
MSQLGGAAAQMAWCLAALLLLLLLLLLDLLPLGVAAAAVWL